MSKKIIQIYLSILVFIFAFFFIYSFRLPIYDQLKQRDLYTETLSNTEIKKAKNYLKTMDSSNINKIRKDLGSIFKSGCYQVDLYDENQEVDSVLLFQGRAPLSSIVPYGIQISQGTFMIEWYPSFSQYYFYYRLFDALMSLGISVLFYHLIKKDCFHPKLHFHSLSSKMLFTFIASTILVFTSFSLMYFFEGVPFEFIMDTWYENENYDQAANKIQNAVKNLDLNRQNKKEIDQILKSFSNGHSYFYVYSEQGTHYAGKNTIKPQLYESEEEVLSAPLYYSYSLYFKNQVAELFITSYPLLLFQIPYLITSLFISFSFYMIILQSFIKRRVQSIQKLQEDVFALSIGNWNHEISSEEKDEIGKLAEDLNKMRLAFVNTMENDQQARKANQDLISSLSHDLRTPLTTLKGYLEILNLKINDVNKRDVYLEKCLDKVEEISYLSNKMFEYSLIYSTDYSAELVPVSIQTIQALIQDHVLYLQELNYQIQYSSYENRTEILANQAMLQRILNNLFSNIQKYSDPSKEVQIETFVENHNYKLSFSNRINQHLEKVESNGIGLKSVQKMMNLHHGSYYQNQVNDIFTIVLTFPLK